MKSRLLLFVAGALFGTGLALSGMTDPSRVIGFLDLFGNWDPTLAFVMGGALLVFGLGYRLCRKSCSLPPACSGPISTKLVLGAVLFGVGWGLGGFCPGPALANLGRASLDAFVFVAAMALGILVAQRMFGADRPG
jgi:uncharacterized membrane protein YedE/YeeE